MAPRPVVPNPLEYTYHPSSSSKHSSLSHFSDSIPHPEPISSTTHHIAGILTTVYGIAQLPPSCTTVAVLWLLHPRLQTQACMAPLAAHLISEYCKSPQHKSRPTKGLIAVSFDQRNHGSREVLPIANEAWRSGNENHAQDMFSCYAGTAVDTSLLMDYLAAYVFPENRVKIVQNVVLGISLGGHAAWHVLMQDERVSSAVVCIGCPDYTRMMSDRARLSKRRCWVEGKGTGFLGSRDFPMGLVEAVKRCDPAGVVWGKLEGRRKGQEHLYDGLSDDEKSVLLPLMTRTLGNKRLLNLSGGKDKLVPYKMGEPFLEWLKRSTSKGGFFEGGGLVLKDVVLPECGHECPPEMVQKMIPFINETVGEESEMTIGKRGSKESRI